MPDFSKNKSSKLIFLNNNCDGKDKFNYNCIEYIKNLRKLKNQKLTKSQKLSKLIKSKSIKLKKLSKSRNLSNFNTIKIRPSFLTLDTEITFNHL